MVDWKHDALCIRPEHAGLDWFPNLGERGKRSRADLKMERRRLDEICGRCPVSTECLLYALDSPMSIDLGIWAGTDARERRQMRMTARERMAG